MQHTLLTKEKTKQLVDLDYEELEELEEKVNVLIETKTKILNEFNLSNSDILKLEENLKHNNKLIDIIDELKDNYYIADEKINSIRVNTFSILDEYIVTKDGMFDECYFSELMSNYIDSELRVLTFNEHTMRLINTYFNNWVLSAKELYEIKHGSINNISKFGGLI